MFRRWMSPLIIVFLAGGLWLYNSTCVFACSCMMPGAPQEEAARSDAVFSGKVTQQTPTAGLDGAEALKVSFEVGQVWKGTVPQEILLATSGSSASCGYTFETGQEYLVYASTNEGQLSVSLCSRTQPLAQAQEDLTALGQSSTPAAAPAGTPETPSNAATGQATRPIVIISGLVVVAAIAALGGWRYARRG